MGLFKNIGKGIKDLFSKIGKKRKDKGKKNILGPLSAAVNAWVDNDTPLHNTNAHSQNPTKFGKPSGRPAFGGNKNGTFSNNNNNGTGMDGIKNWFAGLEWWAWLGIALGGVVLRDSMTKNKSKKWFFGK